MRCDAFESKRLNRRFSEIQDTAAVLVYLHTRDPPICHGGFESVSSSCRVPYYHSLIRTSCSPTSSSTPLSVLSLQGSKKLGLSDTRVRRGRRATPWFKERNTSQPNSIPVPLAFRLSDLSPSFDLQLLKFGTTICKICQAISGTSGGFGTRSVWCAVNNLQLLFAYASRSFRL